MNTTVPYPMNTTVPYPTNTTTTITTTSTTSTSTSTPTTTVFPKNFLRILPVGDSITFGVVPPSRNGTNGYRFQLRENLVRANYTVDFVGYQKSGDMFDNENEGHPGKRISQIHTRMKPALEVEPNVVLLHVGTNDFINNGLGETYDGAPARLQALIDTIYQRLPKVFIVVAQLLPNGHPPNSQRETSKYNAKIPGIVAKYRAKGYSIATVNMGSIALKYLPDKVHP